MPDDTDLAQKINDDLQADALANHFRNTTREGQHNAPTMQKANPPPAGRAGDVVTCKDCDEAIDPRRLAVQPFATRCIDCQTDFERKAP